MALPGKTAILALAGMLLAAVLVVGVSSRPAVAQGQDEAARWRELAERLLHQQYVYGYSGSLGQMTTVQLMPGRVPDGIGVEVPVPPGGRLVGSLARLLGDQATNVQVVVDAPGSLQDAARFYESAFVARGWVSPSMGRPYGGGGFVTQSSPNVSAYYCENMEPDGATVSLTANPLRAGWTDVRLTVSPPSATTAYPAGTVGGTICSGPAGYGYGPSRPYMMSSTPSVPSLIPPEGVPVQSTGGSGGPGSYSTSAIARTEMSPAQLEAHFAPQLADAGWQRVDGTASGPLAWSSWLVPGEGEWHGLLYAIELPGEERRALSVWVVSPTEQMGGPSYGFGTSVPGVVPLMPAQPALPRPALPPASE